MLNRLVFLGLFFFNQNSIYLQVLKIKIENIMLFLFFCFEDILSIILFTIIFIISILSLSL